MGGLLKFIMVLGSVITATVSGTQFKAALIQAIYHIQNYSADQTEYYVSKFGANAMLLTDESASDLSSSFGCGSYGGDAVQDRNYMS